MRTLRTVYHNGMPLLTSQEVLDEMKLSNGQNITEGQLWEIIRLNTAQFVGDMELRRIAGEKDIPDTSELSRLLGR